MTLKQIASRVLLCILWLAVAFSAGYRIGKETSPTNCWDEFGQQTSTTRVEYGKTIPHKGVRPNMIITVCEDIYKQSLLTMFITSINSKGRIE